MIDEVLSRTNPDARILVVGDGDLSFSKSLSEAIISTSRTLTASVLEASEFELVNNYPSSPQNIAKIHTLAESNSKIKLLFNVNATSLDHSIPTSSMSLIIFNFPQTPPETNTHRKVQFQRLLISNFLASALQILSDDVDSDSKIFLTLARGQGGIEYIEKSNLRPNEKDSWQVVEQAAQAGLIITAAFDYHCGEGWQNFGRRREQNNGKSFSVAGSKVYVLQTPAAARTARKHQIAPPSFTFVISFFICEHFDDEQFFKLIEEEKLGGVVTVNISRVQEEDWVSPEDYSNQILHFGEAMDGCSTKSQLV